MGAIKMKWLLILGLVFPVISIAQEPIAVDKNVELFTKLCKESQHPDLRENYCKLAEQQKKAMEIYDEIERAKVARN